MCTNLDALTQKAGELETSNSPDEALVAWFREWLAFTQSYKGVVDMMAAASANPASALYVSCAAVHAASTKLLLRAQTRGLARTDMNGDDLFALMTSLGWAADQPSFAPRADQLFRIMTGAILTSSASDNLKNAAF
ncbi:hypothetical protein MMA231_03979 (plasmid) [Asticcacaulis sp. MM231]